MIQNIKNKIRINKILIKNIDKPICKNCINYQESDTKCTKFGEINVVNGDIEYLFADMCRKYDNYCGITGKYYDKQIILEKN